MTIIPFAWMRAATPLLRPLRALVSRAWLREADVDVLLGGLHPAWRLNRVLAQVEARTWVADDMLALTLRCNGNAAIGSLVSMCSCLWSRPGYA